MGPYGLSKPQETLDVILMASTFNQEVSLLFLDDGVFLLKTKQNPSSIGAKNFSAAYKALSLYGIEKVYVAADSLQQRALTPKDSNDSSDIAEYKRNYCYFVWPGCYYKLLRLSSLLPR